MCLIALLIVPLRALAQLSWTASMATQYEYNSNVFALQPGYTIPGVTTPPYADAFLSYGAKLDATYLWGQQQLRATASGGQYRYAHFGQLNHDDYNFDLDWKWRLGGSVDGLLAVTRSQSMLELYYVSPPQLVLQTQQKEIVKVGVALTPQWRTELSAYSQRIQDPLVDAPNLSLKENSGQAAVKYIETPGVSMGVSAGYLHGDFTGAEGTQAPSYRQIDVNMTAAYNATDVSAFFGRAGYSRRTSDSDVVGGINSISGATFDLDFKRAVTGKTLADLELSRQITSYITNTGSIITTIAALRINWQATYRVGVTLEYNYIHQNMPGQGGTFGGALDGTDRVDRFNIARLSVEYRPVPWLSLKPYARFQSRRSTNYLGGNFDQNVAGVEVALQWEHGERPVPTPFEVQPP
jgi:hypothetical protein